MSARVKQAQFEIEGFPIHAPELAHGHDGFADDGHDALEAFEDEYFWFRCRRALIVDLLRQHAPHPHRFAEIGCGNGAVLAAVSAARPELTVCGVEASLAGLRHARTRLPHAELIQADATRLPFAADFDSVGIFDVLEHIDDDRAVLRSIHQALRPRGLLLVTVPQHRWLWSWVDDFACHRRRYTRRELHARLAETGFEILRTSSYLVWLLPLLVASRLGKHPEKPAAPPLAGGVNLLCELITRGETWLTRRGWDHRWGASLVVVARRRA